MIQEFSEWFLRNPRIQPDAVAVHAIPKWKWPVSPPTNPPQKRVLRVAATSKTVGKKQVCLVDDFLNFQGWLLGSNISSVVGKTLLLDLCSQVKPPSTKVVILFSFFSEGHTAHTAHTICQVLVPDGPLFGFQNTGRSCLAVQSSLWFHRCLEVHSTIQKESRSYYIYIYCIYVDI